MPGAILLRKAADQAGLTAWLGAAAPPEESPDRAHYPKLTRWTWEAVLAPLAVLPLGGFGRTKRRVAPSAAVRESIRVSRIRAEISGSRSSAGASISGRVTPVTAARVTRAARALALPWPADAG